PRLGPGPAMGTGPTGITIAGSDDYARIAFTTGGAPATGVLLTLTWSVPGRTSSYGFVALARGASSGVRLGGGGVGGGGGAVPRHGVRVSSAADRRSAVVGPGGQSWHRDRSSSS